ncbi:FAD-binding protein [Nonomuraea thailandensis]
MMAEVSAEIGSARGPIYLKLSHLPDETVTAIEDILHTTERPTRGTFHAGRGHDYRTHDVEMHISEIGLCGGHSASGVWVDENGATTVPGLYAAGDLACVPHNYMIGAFVFGDLAGAHAAAHHRAPGALPEDQVAAAHELVYRPLRHPDGPRSSRSSTSCAASSTTTWHRPRPGPSWRSRWSRSSGCGRRSPPWGRARRTS